MRACCRGIITAPLPEPVLVRDPSVDHAPRRVTRFNVPQKRVGAPSCSGAVLCVCVHVCGFVCVCVCVRVRVLFDVCGAVKSRLFVGVSRRLCVYVCVLVL